MRNVLWGLAAISLACSGVAEAKGPEDLLKGQLILSDKKLPMSWRSARAYARKLKRLRRKVLSFGSKGKIHLHYAAFFAKPVNDVQVDVVVYDVTERERAKKTAWETFLARRGDRAVFGDVEISEDDLPPNRRYELVVVFRGRALAKAEITLHAPEKPGKTEEVQFDR
jgi:hypothetical protein